MTFEREEKTSSNKSGEKGVYGERVSEETPMGLVEVLEPHGRAYFTVFLVDIHKSGKRTLVRCLNETEPEWGERTGGRVRCSKRRGTGL